MTGRLIRITISMLFFTLLNIHTRTRVHKKSITEEMKLYTHDNDVNTKTEVIIYSFS